MDLIEQNFKADTLVGKIYTYPNTDDAMQVHVHDETNNHITFIMNGSFRCTGNPNIEGKVLKTGQMIIWPPHQPHGFIALEPNSRMMQINTTLRAY